MVEAAMNRLLKTRLERSFQITHDPVVHLEETALNLDLPNLPSNRISGQLWCVVDVRERNTKVIEAGGWQGFSCSLKTPKVKQSVLEALEATHQRLNELDSSGLGEAQLELAFALKRARGAAPRATDSLRVWERPDLSNKLERALYRVAQEGLSGSNVTFSGGHIIPATTGTVWPQICLCS